MAARKDFDRHVASGELLPVYALSSVDTFLLSSAVNALRQRVLTAAPDFNRDELRGGETTMEHVVSTAGMMPMMAERRWLHVYEADKIKAKDQDALLRYLAKPSPTTVLCLSATKIDQRTKVGQRLSKSKCLFVLEPPKQQALAAWIGRHSQAHGLHVEPAAATLLADLIGAELGVLNTTLQQLSLYAGEGQPIKTEHVEALVAPTRVNSIFELTDAIGARNMPQASLLMRNALGGGQSALLLLAMIARQLRQLLHIKEAQTSGAPRGSLAAAAGVPPFLVEGLLRQARQYQESELWRALAAAAQADVRLKSTRLDHGVVLERLLVDIMGTA